MFLFELKQHFRVLHVHYAYMYSSVSSVSVFFMQYIRMNYSQVVVVQDWLNSWQMCDDNIFVVIVFAGCCSRGGEQDVTCKEII